MAEARGDGVLRRWRAGCTSWATSPYHFISAARAHVMFTRRAATSPAATPGPRGRVPVAAAPAHQPTKRRRLPLINRPRPGQIEVQEPSRCCGVRRKVRGGIELSESCFRRSGGSGAEKPVHQEPAWSRLADRSSWVAARNQPIRAEHPPAQRSWRGPAGTRRARGTPVRGCVLRDRVADLLTKTLEHPMLDMSNLVFLVKDGTRDLVMDSPRTPRSLPEFMT